MEDSLKLFHFDLHDNHNFVQSLSCCENENDIKEAQAKSLRNNSRANSTLSLDSLNLKNASLSSSFTEAKDPGADCQDPFKLGSSLTSLNSLGLRIEDVGRISTDLIKVDLQNHNGFQREDAGAAGEHRRPTSSSLEPLNSREKKDVTEFCLQKLSATRNDVVFASLQRHCSQVC